MEAVKRANDMQVGGNHYQSEYQHWDLALAIPYSYLEAAATKYVSRWRKKNGIEDLRKALHYLNKLQESGVATVRNIPKFAVAAEIHKFGMANGLGDMERHFCLIMGTWGAPSELDEARDILLKLMDDAEAAIERPQPVPLTEENKHAERAPKDPTGW
jgi:hypothetical protein